MTPDGSFKFESMQDAESILAYLDALREGFAKGRIRLSTKDKELVLEPKGLIRFDVDAKRKGNRIKLGIKLAWKDQEDPDLSDEPLHIDAG